MTSRVLVPLAVLVGLARTASAHPLDIGYLYLEPGPPIAVALDLDREAVGLVLGVDPARLDAVVLAARASEIAAATFARSPLESSAGPCAWGPHRAVFAGPRTIRIGSTATCTAGGKLRWAFPFVAEARISPRFELMVKATLAGSEQITLVDKTNASVELDRPGVGFGAFVISGIAHIGAHPAEWHDAGGFKLADGIDHILFLLALMLGGGSLLQLVAIATGFTVGHSITLALAALDVVRVPASVIEPLVALTIVFAAAEAFTGRLLRHRWKIASAFGLVHGFAFAAALAHFELTTKGKVLALFGFNLGVELGQIAMILMSAPLVLLLHRDERIGKPMIRGAAALIFAAGLYWFVQRLLG